MQKHSNGTVIFLWPLCSTHNGYHQKLTQELNGVQASTTLLVLLQLILQPLLKLPTDCLEGLNVLGSCRLQLEHMHLLLNLLVQLLEHSLSTGSNGLISWHLDQIQNFLKTQELTTT